MYRQRNSTYIVFIFLVIFIIYIWNSGGGRSEESEVVKMLSEGVHIQQDDSRLVKHVATIIERPVKESSDKNRGTYIGR